MVPCQGPPIAREASWRGDQSVKTVRNSTPTVGLQMPPERRCFWRAALFPCSLAQGSVPAFHWPQGEALLRLGVGSGWEVQMQGVLLSSRLCQSGHLAESLALTTQFLNDRRQGFQHKFWQLGPWQQRPLPSHFLLRKTGMLRWDSFRSAAERKQGACHPGWRML